MANQTGFTVAIPSDVRSLDPRAAEDTFSYLVCYQVFEGLTTFAEDSILIEPSLAESWTESSDFRTWKFLLKSGLVFSDGSPLGAAEVAESFANTPGYRGQAAAQGPLRVELTLPEPNPHFPEVVAQMQYAVRKSVGGGFIGSGAYKIVSRKLGIEIVLARNEKNDRVHPALEKVVFKVVPFTTLLARGLIDGEIDLTDSVAPAILPILRKAENVKIHCQMGLNTGFVALNTTRPPTDNPRIRTAIALAIDRAPMVQRLFPTGFGQAARTLLPPGMFKGAQREFHAFDPEAARKQLAAAGYRGQPIRLRSTWAPRPYLPDPPAIAAEIARMLRAVGLVIDEQPNPSTAEYCAITESGDFDMILAGWIADDTLASTFFADLLLSTRAGLTNISRYSNPQADALVERMKQSRDPAPAALMEEAEAMIERDVPLVPLFHGPQISASGANVVGTVLHPASALRIWSLSLKARDSTNPNR